MAKRGMLPKFRPAQLGRDAPARPSIRPVKPPPPPSPPSPQNKRHASGFGPRGTFQMNAADAELDAPTHTGATGSMEPSTLDNRAVVTPRRDALAPIAPEDGPETAAGPTPRARVDSMGLSFEDETQARAVDDGLLDRLRDDARALSADMNVPYDSLPSLEVRRPYDTYEAEFSERDPVTLLHRESHHAGFADREPSYDEPPYHAPQEPAYHEARAYPGAYGEAPSSNDEPVFPLANPHDLHELHEQRPSFEDETCARPVNEGSGARPTPRHAEAARYAAPVPSFDEGGSAPWNPPAEPMGAPTGFTSMPPPANDAYDDALEPLIPPAPRVPHDVRAPFVMGVQPLRGAPSPEPPRTMTPMPGYRAITPMPGHLPSPMQAIQGQQYPTQGQPYPTAPAPAYIPASPRVMGNTPRANVILAQTQPPQQMHAAMHNPMPMQQPVGHQLEAPQAASAARIGRFAWFVAGAAFGITFAFFATGFFGSRAGRDDAAFPAPAALPVQTAQVAVAPPAAAPPSPQPVSQTSAFAPPPAMPTLPRLLRPCPRPRSASASGLPNARAEAPGASRARFTPRRARRRAVRRRSRRARTTTSRRPPRPRSGRPRPT
ncbi:MAG: hypothetical protein KF819_26970 [Labilithrix sp.]|nr:hypothetical protein [Labilithrix sp.]